MLGAGLVLVLVGGLSFLLALFGRQFVWVKLLGLTGVGSSFAGLVFIGIGIVLIKLAMKTGQNETTKSGSMQPLQPAASSSAYPSNVTNEPANEVITEEKFAAADAGDTDAQLLVGAAYLSGAKGLPNDPERGFQYIHKAAMAGHALASHLLAALYADGLGVQRNFDNARIWAMKAKSHGITDADNMLAAIDAKRRA